MSKAAVARQVGVSRRTVHRWIVSGQLDRKLDDEPVRCGPRRRRPSELDCPYKEIIEVRLVEYPEPSAVRLFEEVRAAGYRGGYGQVKRHVREIRPRPPVEPVECFETEPGHQAQVDFAEFRLPWGKRHALIVVPHRQHPGQQLPDAPPRRALEGDTPIGIPNKSRCASPGGRVMRGHRILGSRSAPSAGRCSKCDIFNGQKCDIFDGH